MKTLLILLATCFVISGASAQEQPTTIKYKKGEVLDIILATIQPDAGEEYNHYRKTAFPIAFDYSFELMPVFGIRELVIGTSFPTTFIFGKWENIEKREGFLDNITERLPDFHDQRRNVFSYFGLTYYEMKEDLIFFIDEEKHIIANAFWKESTNNYSDFLKDWKKRVEESGGEIVLELTDGKSPTGYFYNPDSFIIVEWENEQAFEEFSSRTAISDYEVLENVHQFRIE